MMDFLKKLDKSNVILAVLVVFITFYLNWFQKSTIQSVLSAINTFLNLENNKIIEYVEFAIILIMVTLVAKIIIFIFGAFYYICFKRKTL